mmetsp:Transcript_5429/g.12899  ORF Transcript_5429/g.12899 Transcript_5429/m.12899 type:complete len:98 (-) Transcript_5429:3370-3663(-)
MIEKSIFAVGIGAKQPYFKSLVETSQLPYHIPQPSNQTHLESGTLISNSRLQGLQAILMCIRATYRLRHGTSKWKAAGCTLPREDISAHEIVGKRCL